jgi:ATP adenylyltransferase
MSHKKHLWAPWKMEYIKNKDASQKIFSSKPNETEDKENLILYRGEFCYIIMNYYPYNNGHLMIVPYEESDSVVDLADKTLTVYTDHPSLFYGGDFTLGYPTLQYP